jgi:hypothetical protein
LEIEIWLGIERKYKIFVWKIIMELKADGFPYFRNERRSRQKILELNSALEDCSGKMIETEKNIGRSRSLPMASLSDR